MLSLSFFLSLSPFFHSETTVCSVRLYWTFKTSVSQSNISELFIHFRQGSSFSQYKLNSRIPKMWLVSYVTTSSLLLTVTQSKSPIEKWKLLVLACMPGLVPASSSTVSTGREAYPVPAGNRQTVSYPLISHAKYPESPRQAGRQVTWPQVCVTVTLHTGGPEPCLAYSLGVFPHTH